MFQQGRDVTQLSALLLRMLRLSLLTDLQASSLTLVPSETFLVDTLERSLPRNELLEIIAALEELTQTPERSAPIFKQITAIVQSVRQSDPPNGLREHIDALQADMDIVQAVSIALNTPAVEQLHIELDRVSPLRYIQTIDFPVIVGEPVVTLIGAFPQGWNAHDVTIPLNQSTHYIESRTELQYSSTSLWPKLNINTPTRTNNGREAHKREEWQQQAYTRYDLEVYTYEERLAGTIKTREVRLPARVGTAAYSVSIPNYDQARLIKTDITDDYGSLLTSCYRLFMTQ